MIFITLPIISRITALSSGPTMARTHPSPGSRPRSRSVWRMENATGEDHDYYHCHVHDHVRYHYPIVMFFLTFTFIIIVIRTIIRSIIMIIAVCLCKYDWNDSNAMPNLHLHDSLLVGSGKKNLQPQPIDFFALTTPLSVLLRSLFYSKCQKNISTNSKTSRSQHSDIPGSQLPNGSMLRFSYGSRQADDPDPQSALKERHIPVLNGMWMMWRYPMKIHDQTDFVSQVDKLQLHHLRNIDTKGKGYYKGS